MMDSHSGFRQAGSPRQPSLWGHMDHVEVCLNPQVCLCMKIFQLHATVTTGIRLKETPPSSQSVACIPQEVTTKTQIYGEHNKVYCFDNNYDIILQKHCNQIE